MKTPVMLILGSLLLFTACEKEAGEGGTSSIKGKVWVKNYNGSFTNLNNEYPGVAEDVYIIYGDDVSYGDRIEANHNGEYEFRYLNKGKYTIYVYSKDSAAIVNGNTNAPDMTVVKQVEITGKKQTVEAPLITIYN
jgi:hypothetical protein